MKLESICGKIWKSLNKYFESLMIQSNDDQDAQNT